MSSGSRSLGNASANRALGPCMWRSKLRRPRLRCSYLSLYMRFDSSRPLGVVRTAQASWGNCLCCIFRALRLYWPRYFPLRPRSPKLGDGGWQFLGVPSPGIGPLVRMQRNCTNFVHGCDVGTAYATCSEHFTYIHVYIYIYICYLSLSLCLSVSLSLSLSLSLIFTLL